MKGSLPRYITNILRLSVLLVLIGRGYQHLFFALPYTIFHSDGHENAFLAYISEGFQVLTDLSGLTPQVWWSLFGIAVGLFFIITAALIYWPNVSYRITHPILIISSILLFFLSFTYFLAKGFHVGQWVEYTSQTIAPLLIVLVQRGIATQKFLILLKIAIACTFVGHGLFALGVHPIPDNYLEMVGANLGVNASQAKDLLFAAGVLDVMVGIGIFLPTYGHWFLSYAVWWGFITSLARVTTQISLYGLSFITLHESLFKFLFRTPHFLFALIVLLTLQWIHQVKSKKQSWEVDEIESVAL